MRIGAKVLARDFQFARLKRYERQIRPKCLG